MAWPGWFQLLAWVAFFSTYLLLAGKLNLSEAVVGAVSATACLWLVRLLGGRFKRTVLIKPGWLLLLWRIPVAMLSESWLLLKALLLHLAGHRQEGSFMVHRYPAPDDEHDSARRAYMAFGVCITPNSYLVFYDRDNKEAVIRQLAGPELSKVDRLFVELP